MSILENNLGKNLGNNLENNLEKIDDKSLLEKIDLKRAELGITNEELGNMTITSRSKIIEALKDLVLNGNKNEEIKNLFVAVFESGLHKKAMELFSYFNIGLHTDYKAMMNEAQRKEYNHFSDKIMEEKMSFLSGDDWDVLRLQIRDAVMCKVKDRKFEYGELYESARELGLESLKKCLEKEGYVSQEKSIEIGD